MSRLALYLLGPPRFQLDEVDISIPRRKVAALLIYLAVTAKAHSREMLVDLLFPKQSRQRARGDFRNTLSLLRNSIGDNRMFVDGSIVCLKAEDDIWIDVTEFRALSAEASESTLQPSKRIKTLAAAVDLYSGDFLSGFFLKDSVRFDEWQFLEEEGLRRDYSSALQQLVTLLEQRGDLESAIDYGRKWLALDPLEEAVHRELIRMYAAAGNRTLALRQYEKCREILEKELAESPEEETEELVEQVRSKSSIRSSRSHLEEHPNNLPFEPLPFVGREAELSELIDTLNKTEVQILTLTGAGGTGKTRLAIEAATSLAAGFDHGAFFVDLTRARKAAEVIPALARVLEIREPIGRSSSLLAIVKGYLRDRRLLLLLDNFEHVCTAADQIASLVHDNPDLKVLVTSRERLRIKGEVELQISPLKNPEPDDERNTRALLKVEAVRLFTLRASAVNPDFSLTDQNAGAVAEICRHLDGLPLAIELAASRINILSAQDLMQMLGDRLALLRERSSARPPRHQTLCRAIDWSYNLLEEEEKKLFTNLSVFSGGCSFQAVEQVCGTEDSPEESGLLDTLASLIDKNLVRQEIVDGDSRFSMLETIGECARTHMGEVIEARAVRKRHAEHYLRLALKAEPELHGPDQLRWLDRLERENGNLYAALSWCLEERQIKKALQLAASLKWFWYRYGHFSEGKNWLEQTLLAACTAKHPLLRAKALDALGWTLFIQGEWDKARQLYVQSLELFREQGDRAGEGIALSDLGVAERWLGNRSKGDRYCAQAVEIAREVGDPLQISLALIWAFATTGGVFDGVCPITELEEVVAVSRRLGNLWGVSHGLNGQGDFLRESGRYEEARPRYEEALRGFQKLRDRWMTAWTLEGLGTTLSRLGEYCSARGCLKQGLSLFRGLGDREDAGLMLGRLGMAERAAGHHRQAARILGACQALRGVSQGNTEARSGKIEKETQRTFAEYARGYPEEWSKGKVMSYEQAVEFALNTEKS
jgi:predicted ATPase/DNA-binding SARP family transcriptional activator